MRKVLHILNSLLPSGAETMLYCSADYWNKELEKHILVTNKNIGEYAEKLERAGYIIHQIYNCNYFKQHRAVRKFIRNNQFDIVHIHRQGEACSYALDAKMAGTSKIIRTVHNVFVFHGLIQIREFFARHISCMVGCQHIAISPSVKENEWRRFRVKCMEIRNWYNSDRFGYVDNKMKINARNKLNLDFDRYYIVSVGNCTPVKNHMSILSTLVRHKNDTGFKDVIYLHIGKGIQENEEIEYARINGLENVKFFGFSDPDLYLQAADLFVMPSTYEGFGISGIEGLATGVRTIFTDVPGLKDFKTIGFDNLVFSELSDDSIDECLCTEVKNREVTNSKKQADKIRSIFGIQEGVKYYEEVYFS